MEQKVLLKTGADHNTRNGEKEKKRVAARGKKGEKWCGKAQEMEKMRFREVHIDTNA